MAQTTLSGEGDVKTPTSVMFCDVCRKGSVAYLRNESFALSFSSN